MIDYNKHKAHPTMYKGVQFRSRLEATWAAFFDLAGWKWEYEPVDLEGWSPDFYVEWACNHSQCQPESGWGDSATGIHCLYVEVKPAHHLKEFEETSAYRYINGAMECGVGFGSGNHPAVAFFGLNPEVSSWCMAHGHGGGFEEVGSWVGYKESIKLWKQAKNATQWRPQ